MRSFFPDKKNIYNCNGRVEVSSGEHCKNSCNCNLIRHSTVSTLNKKQCCSEAVAQHYFFLRPRKPRRGYHFTTPACMHRSARLLACKRNASSSEQNAATGHPKMQASRSASGPPQEAECNNMPPQDASVQICKRAPLKMQSAATGHLSFASLKCKSATSGREPPVSCLHFPA